MREEFYDRGLGYDNGYRGMLNGGSGWPSPRGGFAMERDMRERGLGLGAGSPILGDARGRNTLGAGLGGGPGGPGVGLGAVGGGLIG